MKLWPFGKKSDSEMELPPGVMLASPDEADSQPLTYPTPAPAMHAPALPTTSSPADEALAPPEAAFAESPAPMFEPAAPFPVSAEMPPAAFAEPAYPDVTPASPFPAGMTEAAPPSAPAGSGDAAEPQFFASQSSSPLISDFSTEPAAAHMSEMPMALPPSDPLPELSEADFLAPPLFGESGPALEAYRPDNTPPSPAAPGLDLAMLFEQNHLSMVASGEPSSPPAAGESSMPAEEASVHPASRPDAPGSHDLDMLFGPPPLSPNVMSQAAPPAETLSPPSSSPVAEPSAERLSLPNEAISGSVLDDADVFEIPLGPQPRAFAELSPPALDAAVSESVDPLPSSGQASGYADAMPAINETAGYTPSSTPAAPPTSMDAFLYGLGSEVSLSPEPAYTPEAHTADPGLPGYYPAEATYAPAAEVYQPGLTGEAAPSDDDITSNAAESWAVGEMSIDAAEAFPADSDQAEAFYLGADPEGQTHESWQLGEVDEEASESALYTDETGLKYGGGDLDSYDLGHYDDPSTPADYFDLDAPAAQTAAMETGTEERTEEDATTGGVLWQAPPLSTADFPAAAEPPEASPPPSSEDTYFYVGGHENTPEVYTGSAVLKPREPLPQAPAQEPVNSPAATAPAMPSPPTSPIPEPPMPAPTPAQPPMAASPNPPTVAQIPSPQSASPAEAAPSRPNPQSMADHMADFKQTVILEESRFLKKSLDDLVSRYFAGQN